MRKLLVCALFFACSASGIPSSTTQDLASASDLSRKGGVGSACLTDEQCSTPKCLGDPMWPGSYCTTLKFDCARDRACPSGSVCGAAVLRGSPPVDVCLDLCNTDDDCRRDEGYGCCLHDNGSEVCLPLELCRRAVGSACTASSQCERNCLLDPAWPGGYCTTIQLDCSVAADCPSGSICGEADPPGNELCLQLCRTDDDCRRSEGYGCCLTSAGRNVCVPLRFCR